MPGCITDSFAGLAQTRGSLRLETTGNNQTLHNDKCPWVKKEQNVAYQLRRKRQELSRRYGVVATCK
jgi:hypothetical protein